MSDLTLQQAKEIILAQQAELERIAQSPLTPAIVTKHEKDETGEYMYVSSNGSIKRVASPKDKPKVGECILLFATGHMSAKGDIKQIPVKKAVVLQIGEHEHCAVSNDGQPITILKLNHKVKEGDNVIIDQGGTVILENLGQNDGDTKYTVTNPPEITWKDIGGLKEAKLQMIEAVESVYKHKDLYKHYGKKQPKGILLYGSPGCGKTLLAKAAANSIAKMYGNKASSSGFMYVKGPELLNKYVGESESNIRTLFIQAKQHKMKYGYPAIIFIDEADALLAKRGMDKSSHMSGTIVPMFLTEMDGMEESSALVILATNRQDILDPAVVREGRIDRKIRIDRPQKCDALEILHMNLKNVPTHNCKTKELAKIGVEALYDETRIFYQIETRQGIADVTLAEMVNGAMIANIADYAMQLAMRRDIENDTITGITELDIMHSVDNIDSQNRDLNHEDMLAHLTDGHKDKITNIHKVTRRGGGNAQAEEAA